MKVKMFERSYYKAEYERKVNDWFDKNRDIEIFRIIIGRSRDDMGMYVFYKEGKEDEIGFK